MGIKFLSLIAAGALCAFARPATAMDAFGMYRDWVPYMATNYLSQVDDYSADEQAAAGACDDMYARVHQRKLIEIRYAFGYFDGANGADTIFGGVNFGQAPSYDLDFYYGLVGALETPCPKNSRLLCGFSPSGDPDSGKIVFEKTISFAGADTLVRITLTRASYSRSFEQNKNEFKAQQALFTAQSQTNFFGGLKDADVVFYNGHSRNGGGPDFAPPVLNSIGHADYNGFYLKKKAGLKALLAGLKGSENPGLILGLFSCFGEKNFSDAIAKINPRQRIILGIEKNVADLNMITSTEASLGFLEGILHGRCGDELTQSAIRTSDTQKAFAGFHLN